MKIIKKYQQKNSVAPPPQWFQLSSQYDDEKTTLQRADGDDYSFVNYIGDKKLGVEPFITTINFMKDGLNFKIPIYLIQGELDIQTPEVMTRKYFDKIKAPKKDYFLLPKTEHGFNQSVIDKQYQILTNLVAHP